MVIGLQEIAGAWLSTTTTICVQLWLLLFASVAVQTTRLVPTGNTAGALLPTVGEASQASETPGVPKTTPVAKHCDGFALTVTVGGQVIIGGIVSNTVRSAGLLLVTP